MDSREPGQGKADSSCRGGGGRSVVIVYKWIPQYRQPFFELLRQTLSESDVDLGLVYGAPSGDDALKGDATAVSWGVPIRNRFFRVGRHVAIWQPCFSQVRAADLIIVEQANRLLVNYVLLLRRWLGHHRVAFWGHGRNFQAGRRGGLSEWLKARVLCYVDWWFAYGPTSAEVVAAAGFERERITEVQNSVDTSALTHALEAVTESRLLGLRASLGLVGQHVCIFCGAMYPEKRLLFLIEACERVRKRVPDFEMLFLGGGISGHIVDDAAKRNTWMHAVGPVFGDQRAAYFALSALQLMPGLVGLGIIDSFATGVPLVTTSVEYHSPEIEYLINGVNGAMVDDSEGVEGYSRAVVDLLLHEANRAILVEGCHEAAQKYTLEAMVRNFAAGVLQALEV